MGNESVLDDREVERDTRVEADGVVIRETAPICLRKGIRDCEGRAMR